MKVTKYKRKTITLNARDHLRNPEKIPPNAKMVIYTNKRIVVDTDMQSANSNKDILASINKQLISLNAKTDAIDTRLTKLEKDSKERFEKMEKDSKERFEKMEKENNARFDKIDKDINEIKERINYVVKANKLKDLPKK